jgi:hypothetical protein
MGSIHERNQRPEILWYSPFKGIPRVGVLKGGKGGWATQLQEGWRWFSTEVAVSFMKHEKVTRRRNSDLGAQCHDPGGRGGGRERRSTYCVYVR